MSDMLSFEAAAEQLGIGVAGVTSLVTEHKLLALPGADGLAIPASLLDGDVPVKHLSGVLTLLHDAGYDTEQAMGWLTAQDDSLPGTPLQALHENRATEVKRRAQALAF